MDKGETSTTYAAHRFVKLCIYNRTVGRIWFDNIC